MKFEKVSFNTYIESFCKCMGWWTDTHQCDLKEETYDWIKESYENIKLPKRSTTNSAGYDFYIPYDQKFSHKKEVLLPTGIRFKCDPDKFLLCVPRSGLGFKYGMQLRNTCGVIDADYYDSDNEGHIMVKVITDEDFELRAGKAIMQGIIMPYYKVEDDSTNMTRNGGFGSTDKN